MEAFYSVLESGFEWLISYAILLIEDSARYGWLSEEAKEQFYQAFEDEEEPV